MSRTTFLTIVGAIGLVIGSIALVSPTTMLVGKGVAPEATPAVWMREVGVLVLAVSVMLLCIRRQPDSPTMRVVLWGNALVHAGLFPIGIVAWQRGVIPRFEAIAPNSALHLVVACGFAYFAWKTRAAWSDGSRATPQAPM